MLIQQNTHDPAFNVSGLRAGRSYVLTVYAQNAKGRSSPVTLYSFTIKVLQYFSDELAPFCSLYPVSIVLKA